MPTPRPLPVLLILAVLAPLASAQGLLIDDRHPLPRPIPLPGPRPTPVEGGYHVQSIDINATLNGQAAEVQVSQTFQNDSSRPLEVSFVFPLPYDAAVSGLTLLVDGKEHQGKLLSADEARRRFEAIVRSNRDPALLEWLGHGMFQTSVFPVPAGGQRTLTLRYSQLCRMSHGLTDLLLPLATAKYTSKPLEKLSVRVAINSHGPIASVYSPTHDLKIERSDDRHAVATYAAQNEIPSADLRLMVAANPPADSGPESGIGASVVSYRPNPNEPGYFLLLASPELADADAKPLPKTVLFVVDRSGSMTGKKLDQAKSALKFVLNNLNEEDTFNIIAYDDKVESFRPELQRCDDQQRRAAVGYVDGLFAGGSTNIDAALRRALGMLNDSDRPTYVLFLTDGLPTAGQTGEAAIVAATQGANNVRARVFPFGVGYDVNSRLLDRLARENFGATEYVRPNEDIEAAVSKLYRRIGAPVMTDVSVAFDLDGAKPEDGPAVTQLYPRGGFDLFAGDQTIVVGRYRHAGDARVTLSGAVAGKEEEHAFATSLAASSDDDSNAFVARLWATRRVGEIIDQLDLGGKNDELIKELVDLATHHGVVTQYTSFLADENADHNAVADNRTRADEETEALAASGGEFGFNQRAGKQILLKSNGPPMPATAPADAAPQELARQVMGRASGNAFFYDARRNRTRMADNIRQIGRKTFFRRDGKWVDSTVTDDELKQTNELKRYSPEYFQLAADNGRHVAQYLAIEEPVVVKVGGRVYSW
ncbi:von Willebrand factor type A domain protein [Posidoniimonas polymericola]|uniref:von Willebrand factor type A domain protein n=1 Tax=Posidoniimonas polymericola TaxID=2528002 RepID=A0A5C5YRR3_9BACT|nr:VIT domain-containing protein [Posidoniimonas polymericola]TWT77641.1 von Willebrand factor type A domain protein [Posidoniimonas polymericola]